MMAFNSLLDIMIVIYTKMGFICSIFDLLILSYIYLYELHTFSRVLYAVVHTKLGKMYVIHTNNCMD